MIQLLEYYISYPSSPRLPMLPTTLTTSQGKDPVSKISQNHHDIMQCSRCNQGLWRQQCPRMTSIHRSKMTLHFMSTFALALHLCRRISQHRYISCSQDEIYLFNSNDNGLPSSLYGKNKVHFTAGDHTCPRNLESVFIKALDTFGEVNS